MTTDLATLQNWKNNKEKKKPCPGRKGVQWVGFVRHPRLRAHRQLHALCSPSSFPFITAMAKLQFPSTHSTASLPPNKFSTFFLLSLELCSFFVPGDLRKRFNLLAIVFQVEIV